MFLRSRDTVLEIVAKERAGQWQLAVDLSDQFQKEGIT